MEKKYLEKLRFQVQIDRCEAEIPGGGPPPYYSSMLRAGTKTKLCEFEKREQMPYWALVPGCEAASELLTSLYLETCGFIKDCYNEWGKIMITVMGILHILWGFKDFVYS